jgi:DMSO reductase family type II enzyme molybdopterin subunit
MEASMSLFLELDRRTFLKVALAGGATLTLGLSSLRCRSEKPEALLPEGVPAPPPYGDWRDVYRERWAWDKVVRSSHWVNCWYQAHCAWNVYVKDGLVWREEQAADYPQIRPDVPDFNPRGCQKGACFSERMYDPARVRYPLKRAGERGSGRWKRVSWEQALDEIAESMVATIVDEGSDRIVWDEGPGISVGVQTAGRARLTTLIDSTVLDMNTEIGDGHRGVAETFGKILFERSADDYFFSDMIVCWGSNPYYTQIPNAHFLTEARYNGAQIVCITPDFNPSSIHADLWVPVKPGGDAALGLGICHVLVEENLVDRAFVTEQTDLPLLVRDDTGLLLRASDLAKDGDDDELQLLDAERGVVPAPRKTLALGDLRPVLEGKAEVALHDGKTVGVRTVFARLREHLAGYSPEQASRLCGTPAPMIRELATRFASAKSACMVTTSNFGKAYHGNLTERTQALVYALTGNYGKKGSGFVGFPFLVQDGLEHFILDAFPLPARAAIGAMRAVDETRLRLAGYTDEMIVYERSRAAFASGNSTSGALFWYVHAGLIEASERLQEWDPYLKRPIRDVLKESLDKGWQYVWPKPGNDPRVMFSLVSNPLRRVRCYPLLLKNLWPKLRTIVTIDWRMTSTGMWADYVLPAAAWYERSEHKWVTPLMPFIHGGEKATSFYEAKSDWEIHSRLAEAVDRAAAARGVTTFRDRNGNERSFEGLYAAFSSDGSYGHADDEKVAARILEQSTNLAGVEWKDLKKKGWARFTSLGTSLGSIGTQTDIRPDDTITPLTHHVVDKKPYPTLSRRMQFYLDQPLYVEMGEQLPTHKEPPLAGGNYPLVLSGGHTRWSIHSAWRDDKLMLQLQRGEPVMYMSAEDAASRGIADGERARVYNDLDAFEIMAKVAPSVRPGEVIIYHAWENFQFKDQKGFQNLIPSPLNPVELAGGQFHFRPMGIAMQPSHTDRDTRVEVARA